MMEGELYMLRGQDTWKPFYFIAGCDCLHYYQSKPNRDIEGDGMKSPPPPPLGSISLKGGAAFKLGSNVSSNPLAFAFHIDFRDSPGTTFDFCTNSRQDMKEWKKIISAGGTGVQDEFDYSQAEADRAEQLHKETMPEPASSTPAIDPIQTPDPVSLIDSIPTPDRMRAPIPEETRSSLSSNKQDHGYVTAATPKHSMMTEADDRRDMESWNRQGDRHIQVEFYGDQLLVDLGSEEAENLLVVELKARVCFQISKAGLNDPASGGAVRPEDLSLAINDAPLQNHWRCSDVGLHGKSRLQATVNQGSGSFTLPSVSTPLFVLHVEFDGPSSREHREELLEVRRDDIPEVVAAGFARLHGLDASWVPPLVAEIYKGLTKAFSTEIRMLQSQLTSYKVRESAQMRVDGGFAHPPTASINDGESEILRSHKILLMEAANQIESLEAECQRLADELFEVRIARAERLAVGSELGDTLDTNGTLHVSRDEWRRLIEEKRELIAASNRDREKLIAENQRLREALARFE